MTSMSPITWLHISDLHIKQDLAVRADYGAVLNELLHDVQRLIAEEHLQPDFIAVTGDLTYHGRPDEFKLAGFFLQDLLEITGIDKDRLFVVPGNHDVNRLRITGYLPSLHRILDSQEIIAQTLLDADLRKAIFRRQTNYFRFCNQFFGATRPLGPARYFAVHSFYIEGRRVAVLALNSAYMAGSDEDRNRLLVGRIQVIDAVDQAQAEGADIVFALMHHPFDWLHDCDEYVVKNLVRKYCQVVLRGHTHIPDITLEISIVGRTLVIPAGATLLAPDRANSYNFARLDLDAWQASIYLRRWSSETNLWVADTLNAPPDGKLVLNLPPPTPRVVCFKPRLPPAVPYFVGRQQETDKVLARLTRESSQPPVVVGIWGMTGVGKTCLGLHLAHHKKVQERFPDGVLWADLSKRDPRQGSVDPMDVLGDWAAQLGSDVHSYRSLDSRADAVRRLLADRRCLLILDDVRNCNSLDYLLPTSRGCAALVISQNRNVVLAVDPDPVELIRMTPEEAEKLFRRILGDERVDEELEAVRRIADTLSHLPLSLDLIAAKLHSEPEQKLADMATILANPRDRFWGDEDRFPQVRAGFYTTFEGLSREQKIRFRRLAVFGSDSFDASAVAALGTEDRVGLTEKEEVAKEGLDQLRQLSLVELVEERIEEKKGEKPVEKRRWSLHPLLHYYANAELEKAQERSDVTSCAARYFCGIAKRLTKEGESEKEGAWIELEALRPHITRSLKWYQEHSPEEFVRYVLDTFRFYYVRGYWEETEKRLGEALSQCHESMEEENALLKKNLSLLYYRRGRLAEALPLLWEALAGSRQLGNRREEAAILIRIGWIYENRSLTKEAYDEANFFYDEALRISQKLPDSTEEERKDGQEMIAKAEHQIANVAFLQGDYPKARDLYERSIHRKEQLGDRLELSKGWRQLAMVEAEEGNLQKARELLEKSLKYEESTGELRKLHICLTRLALVKAEIGIRRRDGTLLAEALDHAQEANHFAIHLGTPWAEAYARYAIGFTYLLKGQWDQAEEYLEISRVSRERIQDISLLASSHLRLGQLAELRGDANADKAAQTQRYDVALGHYIKAHDYKEQIGDKKHAEEAARLAGRVGQKLRRLQATAKDSGQAERKLSLRIRLECAGIACDYECRKCSEDLVKAIGKMEGVSDVYLSGTAGLDARLHIVFDSNGCTQDKIMRKIRITRTQLDDYLVPREEACGEYEELSIDDLRTVCSSESAQSVVRSEQ
jgi:tetratricopeptide (TPR) repeat protein/predicted phosphodiesterase